MNQFIEKLVKLTKTVPVGLQPIFEKTSNLESAVVRTVGQLILANTLPKDAIPPAIAKKKEIFETLYNFIKKNPEKGGEVVDKLNRLGHDFATQSGYSITLDDVTPPVQAKTMLNETLAKIQKISDPNERKKTILEVREKLLKNVPALAKENNQFKLVDSGARGNTEQYIRSYVASVAAKSHDGVVPWLIKHSFSEGLRPSEYVANSVETRLNNITAHMAITQPGDFSKILVNNMADVLILKEDCGTTNGIEISTDSAQIIDRFLAKSAGNFPANTLISPQVATQLRKKFKTVVVRSPITCELSEGVCQKCYGLNEWGKLPVIGTNVGIRSAQAITEPLTQFTLSAKHSVLKVTDATQLSAIKQLRQFLDIPKIFAGKAIVASQTGKITKIETAPQGGTFVFVDDQKHYVPSGQNITVKIGQAVEAGDTLSTGIPAANEVLKYKGIGPGRLYVVNCLQKMYQDQGADLDQRHFELLARSHLNYVKIEDDPENRFLPGEIVNYQNFKKALGKETEIEIEKAEGRFLAKNYLHFLVGTPITKDVIQTLKRHGIKAVSVAVNPPKFTFYMEPITTNPLLNPDWMARLGHRYLKQSLLEAAHVGQEANLHSSHPLPAYAYGAEFGRGEGKRY